jgi:hypothetical protein
MIQQDDQHSFQPAHNAHHGLSRYRQTLPFAALREGYAKEKLARPFPSTVPSYTNLNKGWGPVLKRPLSGTSVRNLTDRIPRPISLQSAHEQMAAINRCRANAERPKIWRMPPRRTPFGMA